MKKKTTFNIHITILVCMLLATIILAVILGTKVNEIFVAVIPMAFLLIWIISIFVFDGCIFTKIENWYSKRKFGEEFYPNYSKKDSTMYQILQKICRKRTSK